MNSSPTDSVPQNHTLHSVQHLRGIAALLVVAFHLQLVADVIALESNLLKSIAHFGEFGVDIFFVLSGFLMIYTTQAKSPGFIMALDFMRARIIRIVPLYWLLTLLFAAMLFALPKLFDNHPFDFYHLWKSLLFIPTHNAAGAPLPVVYPGWTLNYEMFFYVIFAATLCFTRTYVFPVIAILFGVLSMFSLAEPSGFFVSIYTSPLLLEFVAGCAIALVYLNAKATGWMLPLFSLIAGLALIFYLDDRSLHRCIRYGIPATFIVFGMLALEKECRWIRLRTLYVIGDSSYSLYLTHAFTIPIVLRLILKFGKPAILHPTVIAFGIVAMCAVVGHATYILVEKRLTKWARTRAKSVGRASVAVPA